MLARWVAEVFGTTAAGVPPGPRSGSEVPDAALRAES